MNEESDLEERSKTEDREEEINLNSSVNNASFKRSSTDTSFSGPTRKKLVSRSSQNQFHNYHNLNENTPTFDLNMTFLHKGKYKLGVIIPCIL